MAKKNFLLCLANHERIYKERKTLAKKKSVGFAKNASYVWVTIKKGGFVDEGIPRRKMRFYRKKPTEEEARQKSSELAINEVDSFRHAHNRYPNKVELEEISENIFDQLKKELEKSEEEAQDIYLGEVEKGRKGKGKTLADERKQRRLALRKAEEKEKANKGKAESKNGKGSKEEAQAGVQEETEAGEKEKAKESTAGFASAEPERAGLGDESSQGRMSLEVLEMEHRKKEGVRKLAEIDELSKLESELSGDDGLGEFDMLEKEVDTNLNFCPRCKSRTEDLIYCPDCGDAFCDNCAKKIEALPEAVKYSCPKCGAEIKRRRAR